jgi:hypothetical protein
MQTDTIRVLTDEELDCVAGGLDTSLAGEVTVGTTEVSFQDVGVSTSGNTATVDLGGAYAEASPLSFATHTSVTV